MCNLFSLFRKRMLYIEHFEDFRHALQLQWDLFCTDPIFRKKMLLGDYDYYDTFSSDISGSVPTLHINQPYVVGMVELRHEPFCTNVFGLVPKRGDMFVGFVLDENCPLESVRICFGDAYKNVRTIELLRGQPQLVFEKGVIVTKHLYLEVRTDAEQYVHFVYAFVHENIKRWFDSADFVCPIEKRKWMIYRKNDAERYCGEFQPTTDHYLELTTLPPPQPCNPQN